MDWNAFGAEMQAMSQRVQNQMMMAPQTLNLQISFVPPPQPQHFPAMSTSFPAVPPMPPMSMAFQPSFQHPQAQLQPDMTVSVSHSHSHAQTSQTDLARQMNDFAHQMSTFSQQMAQYGQSMMAQSQQMRHGQSQSQAQPNIQNIQNIQNAAWPQPPQFSNFSAQMAHLHQEMTRMAQAQAQSQQSNEARQIVQNFYAMHSNGNANAMIDLTNEDEEEAEFEFDVDEESEEERFVPWSEDDVPDEFKCPISLSVMTEPVLCSDGFYYDRECIEDWLRTHSRSPMTNLRMTDKRTHRDHVLAHKINEWKEQQWLAHHRRRQISEHKEGEGEEDGEEDELEGDDEEEDEFDEFDEDDEYEFDGEYSEDDEEDDEDEFEDEEEEDGDEAMKW